MKKVLKWLGIGIGGLIVLFIVLAIFLPAPEDSSPAASTPPVENPSQAATPPPTVTPAPPPTLTFPQLKEQATIVSYDDLFRRNEDYTGELVYYKGQIAQIQEQGGLALLRVNVTEGTFGLWDDDIRADYQGERLLEDDIVEFVGLVKGLWKYEAVLGNVRTIPHVEIRHLQLLAKAGGGSPEPTIIPLATDAPTATPMPSPTPRPSTTETFQGQGDSVVGPFTLQEGVVTLTALHAGTSNFAVTIIGQGTQELAVNEIGQYKGVTGFTVNKESFGLVPGDYRMEVDADGVWSLRVDQEFPSSGQSLPFRAQGIGSSVSKWIQLPEGTYLVKSKHTGESNFFVELLRADGSDSTLIVNEIGDYSGESLVQISGGFSDLTPGLSVLVVQADGTWEVSIEQ